MNDTNKLIDLVDEIIEEIFEEQDCCDLITPSVLRPALTLLKKSYQRRINDDSIKTEIFSQKGHDCPCELLHNKIKNTIFNTYPDIQKAFQDCDNLLPLIKQILKENGISCR